MDDVWGGKGADLLAHSLDEVLADVLGVGVALVQGHVRVDALPLDVVVKPAKYTLAIMR